MAFIPRVGNSSIFASDLIEIMKKDGANVPADVLAIEGRDGLPVMSAPHPQEPLKVLLDPAPEPGDILRVETPDAE